MNTIKKIFNKTHKIHEYNKKYLKKNHIKYMNTIKNILKNTNYMNTIKNILKNTQNT